MLSTFFWKSSLNHQVCLRFTIHDLGGQALTSHLSPHALGGAGFALCPFTHALGGQAFTSHLHLFHRTIQHLLQRLQSAADVIKIHLVGDRPILLGGKPYQHHGNVVLHILSGEHGLKFHEFVVDGLCCSPHYFLIFGIYFNAVGAVGDEKV